MGREVDRDFQMKLTKFKIFLQTNWANPAVQMTDCTLLELVCWPLCLQQLDLSSHTLNGYPKERLSVGKFKILLLNYQIISSIQ